MSGCDAMHGTRQLRDRLGELRGRRVVILGVGNELKGDDGAGPLLCHHLAGTIHARVIDGGCVPENYIYPVIKEAPEILLIVDAVDFGGEAGQIRLLEPDGIDSFAFSTHALSLRLLIDLLRREIDPQVHVIGIQPVRVTLGAPLSPAVQQAVEALARILIKAFPPTA